MIPVAPRPRGRGAEYDTERRSLKRLLNAKTRVHDRRVWRSSGSLRSSRCHGSTSFWLPRLIFASDRFGGWHESLLETAIILVVAIPVVVLTRRLVARLHYLCVCAPGAESCMRTTSGSRWRNSCSADSTQGRPTESAQPAGPNNRRPQGQDGRANDYCDRYRRGWLSHGPGRRRSPSLSKLRSWYAATPPARDRSCPPHAASDR
jgi:hypothetical protein